MLINLVAFYFSLSLIVPTVPLGLYTYFFWNVASEIPQLMTLKLLRLLNIIKELKFFVDRKQGYTTPFMNVSTWFFSIKFPTLVSATYRRSLGNIPEFSKNSGMLPSDFLYCCSTAWAQMGGFRSFFVENWHIGDAPILLQRYP